MRSSVAQQQALGLEVPEVLKSRGCISVLESYLQADTRELANDAYRSYADLRLAAQRQVLASGQRGRNGRSARERMSRVAQWSRNV